MTRKKGLVLDANILLRAVVGQRVRYLLEKYEDLATFFTPDVCLRDAQRYLGELCTRKHLEIDVAISVVEQIAEIVEVVDASLYDDYKVTAQARMQLRDPDDWPVAAVALLLDFPIWTEDQDFFGCGIPVWTTDRIELYLDPIKSDV